MIAFKIMSFEHVGSITFCRIYSGKLEQGMSLANTTRDKKERAGRMYLMHAADREEIKEAFAGDIVALQGLKDTRTGETLCDPSKPVILEKMDFPDPVIEMKIEPKTKADQEKMAIALHTLALEDPSFRVSVDPELGETILKGMGELHLDIKVDILKRTYNVEANTGAPQVAYRETLARPTEIDYTHKKQTGGTGQFARVKLKLEPNETGKGNEFETSIVGGSIPKEYIPGVEKGVQSVWDNGILIGFPMVDMKVTLYDGAFHEVDSSAIAFEIASAGGDEGRVREGRRQVARADHGRRSGIPRRVRRWRYRRHQLAARSDPRSADARQRNGDPGIRAARQYVRLHQYAALDVDWARAVYDAVCALRGRAAQRGGRGQGEVRLRNAVSCQPMD